MLHLQVELHYEHRPSPKRIPVDAFPFTIGRSRANDLLVTTSSVSSRHLCLDVQEQTLLVTDQASSNGTFIDGRRLPPHDPVAVELPVQIRLGTLLISLDHHPGVRSDFQATLASKSGQDDPDAQDEPAEETDEGSNPPRPTHPTKPVASPSDEPQSPPETTDPTPDVDTPQPASATPQETSPPQPSSLGGIERFLLGLSLFAILGGVALLLWLFI